MDGPRGVLARSLVIPIALAASGLSVWQSSQAAFSDTGPPLGDGWSSGLVQVVPGTPGTATFAPAELVPGSSGERCITVLTPGGRKAELRAYLVDVHGAADVTARLRLTIDQGELAAEPAESSTGAVTSSSCAGFSGSTLFAGTLEQAAGHDSFGAGLGSSSASAVTYRFRWQLPSQPAVPGGPQSVVAGLRWAQSAA